MKKVLFLCMIISCFFVACDILSEGIKHGEKNTKSDEKDTKSGDFYYEQGQTFFDNKEYQKAIDAYTKAIERYNIMTTTGRKFLHIFTGG